jgi:hypothetical protein
MPYPSEMRSAAVHRFPIVCLAAAICFAAILSFGPTSPTAHAQITAASSLSGVAALYVMVEDLPDGARLHGLAKPDVQMAIEQRLRTAGLRVVTEEESARLPGAPYLYVRINLVDHAHAASVDVELNQGALLVRNGQIIPSAITWSRSALLSKPTVQNIRDAVNDRVDAFVNAWLLANPRRKS